ncbi:MAG: DUF2169 family type VI secretion system accessory protein [Candidatus Krumholzibacteriia bacterium]
MKIVNETPFLAEALPFPWPDGRAALTIILKGTFTIRPDERAEPAAEQLPILFADAPLDPENPALGARFEADVVPFKPRADIVLVGKAHAPPRKLARALDASLRVGTVKKVVRVIGDRRWTCGGRLLPAAFSAAEPFREMELVYARAFGGVDAKGGGYCRYNPVGRGYMAKKSKSAVDGTPLPNVEDPRHLIRKWDSRPRPAGFGFTGRGWLPRLRYLGTYDDAWRRDRAPAPPEDFRFEAYNGAHPDLQLKEDLRGDEEVELIHLTPQPRLLFRLPAVTPVCAVLRHGAAVAPPPARAGSAGDPLPPPVPRPGEDRVVDEPTPGSSAGERVALNLDTLVFDPEEMRFTQVWRGVFPLADPAAREVAEIGVWLA